MHHPAFEEAGCIGRDHFPASRENSPARRVQVPGGPGKKLDEWRKKLGGSGKKLGRSSK
jgi:hypothetical protein